MQVECFQCQKSIKIKPSKHRENNFCSQDCYFTYKRRDQIRTVCERCGKPIIKSPSKKTARNFCSSQCLMKTLNTELNPIRMTTDVRKKLREAHIGKGEKKSYPKLYGRHEHRVNAEEKIGRPLKRGEVVHHIDGNRQNNNLENLMVFPSQREHAAWHAAENRNG